MNDDNDEAKLPPKMIIDGKIRPAPGINTPTIIGGTIFKPVNIPATGKYQIRRLEAIKSYILVAPDGRQAWFNDDQINEVRRKHPNFKFTSDPLKDLNVLAKLGLRPFHVDADFNVDGMSRQ